MTQQQRKPYQVVVWRDGEGLSDDPTLRLHFDTQEEAMGALDSHQVSGLYRSGMLMEWNKQNGTGGWSHSFLELLAVYLRQNGGVVPHSARSVGVVSAVA